MTDLKPITIEAETSIDFEVLNSTKNDFKQEGLNQIAELVELISEGDDKKANENNFNSCQCTKKLCYTSIR